MRNFDHDLTTQLTETLHKHSDGLYCIDLHIYYFLIRFETTKFCLSRSQFWNQPLVSNKGEVVGTMCTL